MALSHLFTQFVPLTAFAMAADMLAHGVHRLCRSHIELMY